MVCFTGISQMKKNKMLRKSEAGAADSKRQFSV